MSIVASLTPSVYPDSTAIDPHDAAQARRLALRASLWQWHHEGYVLDLAEYQDAALDALVACLAHYDSQRGVAFSVYAAHRIRGAVQRAWQRYRTCHELRGNGRWFHAPPCADVLRPPVHDVTAPLDLAQRVQQLPAEGQRYAVMVLTGATDREYAQQAGLTSARWVQARVARWRQDTLTPMRQS